MREIDASPNNTATPGPQCNALPVFMSRPFFKDRPCVAWRPPFGRSMPLEGGEPAQRVGFFAAAHAGLADRLGQHLDACVVGRAVHGVWRAVLAAVGVA